MKSELRKAFDAGAIKVDCVEISFSYEGFFGGSQLQEAYKYMSEGYNIVCDSAEDFSWFLVKSEDDKNILEARGAYVYRDYDEDEELEMLNCPEYYEENHQVLAIPKHVIKVD